MSVIVYNKRTGKYLKRHSGSFRHAWSRLELRNDIWPILIEKFGKRISYRDDIEAARKQELKRRMYLVDLICDAEPEEARVYHSEKSALSSVGMLNPEWNRHNRDSGIPLYVLPDYLEIHEIKQAAVCVMRPDGTSNCDDDT